MRAEVAAGFVGGFEGGAGEVVGEGVLVELGDGREGGEVGLEEGGDGSAEGAEGGGCVGVAV